MRNFILNHASLAFWIWCVPPFLWLLSTLPAEASLEERISALLLTWTWMLLGGAAINWYSRLLLWRAVKYMEPLRPGASAGAVQHSVPPEPLQYDLSRLSGLCFVSAGPAPGGDPGTGARGRAPQTGKECKRIADLERGPAIRRSPAGVGGGKAHCSEAQDAGQTAGVGGPGHEPAALLCADAGGAPAAGASAPAGSGAGGVPAGEGGGPYGAGGLLLPAGEMAAGTDASGICAGQCQQAACPHPGGGTAV